MESGEWVLKNLNRRMALSGSGRWRKTSDREKEGEVRTRLRWVWAVVQSSELLFRKLTIWVLRLSAGDGGRDDGGGGWGVEVERRRRGLGFVKVLCFRRIDCSDNEIEEFIAIWFISASGFKFRFWRPLCNG